MTRSIPSGASRSAQEARNRHEVIVVGGGQAGLAIGYFLAQRERNLAHCHIAEHHDSGMMFSFEVRE